MSNGRVPEVSTMSNERMWRRAAPWGAAALLGLAGVAWVQSRADDGREESAAPAAVGAASAPAKAALSVSLVSPVAAQWPVELSANGTIAAWQEAVVGAEAGGLRLDVVAVNVGDRVRKGQLLASLAAESVRADALNAQAALQEAEALAQEAQANADRARALQASKAMSAQEAQRALTAEQTARARVQSAQAQVATQAVRLRQTRIVAPDDGVISARVATVGAVVQPGQELFRLIRQQRLEWRAELPSADLARVRPGMKAVAVPPGGQPIEGQVRMVAPTVDASTRNGLVYVDLPASALQAGARAGMFAPGRVLVGQGSGLTLPQTAVLLRDGFSYVFRLEPGGTVAQTKVQLGRRQGDRVEVLSGLDAQAQVVAAGVAFLADGDAVRVVAEPATRKGS
ncbi:efflux RND transporter periplasmic adaptor subunit [Aquabacterium sp. A3]|uniref:efflux RND transporter periplasmic adaptor subunit n=1 Tax=Aquabacterium sp. A3 TaxID=3132829 RepID=UPI00311A16BC